MPAQYPRENRLRISAFDQRGRPIVDEVVVAAEKIGPRAIEYANRFLCDPAMAANLLEESAVAVSRIVSSGRGVTVCNLEAYLFRACIRRINKVKKRELRLLAVQRASRSSPTYAPDDLESKILVNEILSRCNPTVRDMFVRRAQGLPWKEIGEVYGMSAHAAESRFSQALQSIRRKLSLGK
jgi:RNA polymerase sigma factor (sigma-70 family)